MSRIYDLTYMTSTSTGTPFTTSAVTGYNDFQDFFGQNETFTATFKDGSDHYLVAICHLDGSNNVVVDQVLMSSEGSRDLTIPTFSGTVDIAIAPSAHSAYQQRRKNFDPNDASHVENVYMDGAGGGTSSAALTLTKDQLHLCDFAVEVSGWYYGFYCGQKGSGAGTGNYRLGIYDIDATGAPNVVLCTTASVAHGNANADSEMDFDNTLTITNITQANPAVVTYTGTDPSNGDRIYITSVAGMTEVNDTSYLIANVNAGSNTFELQDLTATNVDSSAYTAYTSAGTVHFPKYLGAGDYVLGMCSETNDLRFNAFDNDELSRYGWGGNRGGAATSPYFSKTFTYAALPTDPTSTGTWADNSIFKLAVGLKMVID